MTGEWLVSLAAVFLLVTMCAVTYRKYKETP